jgi:hypothetical protein
MSRGRAQDLRLLGKLAAIYWSGQSGKATFPYQIADRFEDLSQNEN